MKRYYVYLTINLINNKKYIGEHYGELDDDYLGSGTLIQRAINKYGRENFKKEILYISQTQEENFQKEKEFIKAFNACKDSNFYNIHEGGSGGNTIAGWTEEQKRQYSELLSKKYSGEGNPRYGVHLTEETKRKISQNKDTSYMKTEEYRKNMSKAISGEKNGMYGKHHTEESKLKMSINSKGKVSGTKNGMYGKKGDNAINGKKIAMYDKDHNLIKVFNAKTAVLNFLGLKGHTQLDKAIKEKTLYKGYYWENYSVETNTEEQR